MAERKVPVHLKSKRFLFYVHPQHSVAKTERMLTFFCLSCVMVNWNRMYIDFFTREKMLVKCMITLFGEWQTLAKCYQLFFISNGCRFQQFFHAEGIWFSLLQVCTQYLRKMSLCLRTKHTMSVCLCRSRLLSSKWFKMLKKMKAFC